jgi:hypothetical protein
MENIMGKSFNLNSFRFAQMKIDEETGEILEEEVPKDFQQSFAHDKYLIDLGNPEDIAYLRSIGSPLPDMIEGYMSRPDTDKKPFEMKFGMKTLIIPNKLGLYYFISSNKLAKFAFLTPEQVQANEARARQLFQKATLSHTPRPRSATVELTYSSESGSGKGANQVRRVAIIPKLEQLLKDPKMIDYDPLLTTKESHQIGFNIDILRAIFDESFFKQALADEIISKKDIPMIKGKQKLLRDFRAANKTRPETLPSMQQMIAMIIKGTERKFEFDKIHTISMDKKGGNWYPGDIASLIKKAIS